MKKKSFIPGRIKMQYFRINKLKWKLFTIRTNKKVITYNLSLQIYTIHESNNSTKNRC